MSPPTVVFLLEPNDEERVRLSALLEKANYHVQAFNSLDKACKAINAHCKTASRQPVFLANYSLNEDGMGDANNLIKAIVNNLVHNITTQVPTTIYYPPSTTLSPAFKEWFENNAAAKSALQEHIARSIEKRFQMLRPSQQNKITHDFLNDLPMCSVYTDPPVSIAALQQLRDSRRISDFGAKPVDAKTASAMVENCLERFMDRPLGKPADTPNESVSTPHISSAGDPSPTRFTA